MGIDIKYIRDIEQKCDVKLGVADKYLLLKHLNELYSDEVIMGLTRKDFYREIVCPSNYE